MGGVSTSGDCQASRQLCDLGHTQPYSAILSQGGGSAWPAAASCASLSEQSVYLAFYISIGGIIIPVSRYLVAVETGETDELGDPGYTSPDSYQFVASELQTHPFLPSFEILELDTDTSMSVGAVARLCQERVLDRQSRPG